MIEQKKKNFVTARKWREDCVVDSLGNEQQEWLATGAAIVACNEVASHSQN